jgi:tRNA-dihydrouridine synthase
LRTGLESPPARRVIPLSVKTRLGYDEVVVQDWIETLLEEKPAAVSLHGRTLKQKYTGRADWEAIACAVAVARGSGTLILGNGDLQNMRDAERRVRETGVDGVLFGRGAQGDPWMFQTKRQVKEAVRSNLSARIHELPIGLEERFSVMLEHAGYFERHWGLRAFPGLRKHLAWYCRGFRGAAALRYKLVRVNNVGDVVACLDHYMVSAALSAESSDFLFHEHDHESRSRLLSPA